MRFPLLASMLIIFACSGQDSPASPDVPDLPEAGRHIAEIVGDLQPAETTNRIQDLMPDGPDVTEPRNDVPADVGPPPLIENPEFCGAPEYQWLPAEDVGKIVSFKETLLTNVSAETLDGMMAEFGYTKLSPAPYGARTFYLRYVTQDRGLPVEATAVVGVPLDVDLSQPLPVVAYVRPTVGFSDQCAPSADPLVGPGQPLIIASQGFIGVAPDLLGLRGFGEPSPPGTLHPYMVAEPTAIAVLDAVRATLKALADDPELPLGAPEQLVIWGGSQGGHAAFVTDLYAPYYTPELKVVAVATAIAGTDVLKQAEAGLNQWTPTSGILAGLMVSLADWYAYADHLDEAMTDEEPFFLASELKQIMIDNCGPGGVLESLDSLDKIFAPDFIKNGKAGAWEELYPWGCFLAESSIGRSSVPRLSDAPILAIFGENDQLSQPDVEVASMERLCEMGWQIEYHVCAELGHVEAGVAAFIQMFQWTKERLAGEPWPAAQICVTAPPVDCDTSLD